MGVDADIAADQAATSEPAVPGRRRTLGLGLWVRPKKPELRRAFLSLDPVSSEGVRSWRAGRRSGAGVVEDGLNTLRLFLRSFLARNSAMVMSRYRRAGVQGECEALGKDWRREANEKRAYLINDPNVVLTGESISLEVQEPCPVSG